MTIKIATLAFGSSTQTLGLSVVKNSLLKQLPNAKIAEATPQTIHDADFLLVSLYWWRDIYELAWWLNRAGIDPARKRKPTIIVGGMAAANSRPLSKLCHYAFVGDGEATIAKVISNISSGKEPFGIPGIFSSQGCVQAVAESIPAETYIENRKSAIARIELARGCKARCAFCQLAYTKPYREQSFENVSRLIRECPTKSIAVFAPNRMRYSRIREVLALISEQKKHNMGSDVRLDDVFKFPKLDCVRFGVEGFSARMRKALGKVPSRAALVEGLLYVANKMESIRDGGRIRSATAYLIGDLPGENEESICEFWDTLREIDSKLRSRFVLFLSISSFAPSPHTPAWGCPIHPYEDLSFISNRALSLRSGRQKFKNLVIAVRGGISPPNIRLAQMLTIRGDERAAPVIQALSEVKSTILKASGKAAWKAARQMEAMLRFHDFPPENLYREWGTDEDPPWAAIVPTVTFRHRWPPRNMV